MQLDAPLSPIARWALDPAVRHLNHGSYGGCPRAVTEAAARWRAELEAAPMRFFGLTWQDALDRARAALAAFVGAPAARLVFVPNSTTGVAIALGSLAIAAGDELVTTDHAYRACRNQLDRLAAAHGAHVRVVALPRPFAADAAADAIVGALGPRSRALLLDHITSPTAVVLPAARIIAAARARGVAVIVDGAHAPGQLALDVGALGADYYVGNCHKWVCATKAAGFLVAAADAPVRPRVTSHGASPEYGPANRLHAELDWSGTHDPCAYLSVPTALEAVAAEGGGWPAILARNHALACALRARLVDALPAAGPTAALPADADLGCMATVPVALPAGLTADALRTRLLRDGWEVAVIEPPHGPAIRLSAHLYNALADADALAAHLHGLGVRRA